MMADEAKTAQIGPTREMTQRQMVEPVDIRDEEGWQVRTSRVVDTVGRLLRNGLIGKQEADAANWFRRRFHVANLDPAKATDLRRVFIDRGSRPPGSSEPERILKAKDDVWAAVYAVGTIDSPAARILYDVVGRDHTISEWVQNQSFGGFSISRDQAVGLLAGMLQALGAHWSKHHKGRAPDDGE